MNNTFLYQPLKGFLLIYIMFFIVCTSKDMSAFPPSIFNVAVVNNSDNKSTIKSITLHKYGFELSDAIIGLNTDEKLLLGFDDLDDARVKDYKFRIKHYNGNWTPSDLIPSEYLDGFPFDEITDAFFSLNTTTPYIHYELVFPTDYLRITKSGNYMITVFEDFDEESIVLERRFKVIDYKVEIVASVKPPLSLKYKFNKQEIGFSISLAKSYIQNPAQNLKIFIQQNGRIDNIITDIKPVRNNGNELDYHFNNKSIFDGGNEFRLIDIKSFKYKSAQIQDIDYFSDGYHILLWEDESRGNKDYVFSDDINGRKLIRTENESNSSTEADYAWIKFTLQSTDYLINRKIYVIGELTNWTFNEQSQLQFNPESNKYELKLFLKQGYYNYQYIVNDDVNTADISIIEGNHYETNNEYSIFVYYREPGTLYDQLIGFKKIIAPA